MSSDEVTKLAKSVAADVASKTANDLLEDMTFNLRALKVQRRALSLASLIDDEDVEVFGATGGAGSKDAIHQRQARLASVVAAEKTLTRREEAMDAQLVAILIHCKLFNNPVL